MGGGPVGYTNDGYNVVINPGTLDQAARRLAKPAQDPTQLRQKLIESTVDATAFGSLPNAEHAAGTLRTFLGDHVDAMLAAGVSLGDFQRRVDAATQLAYQAEPDTVKVSRIPTEFSDDYVPHSGD